VVVAVDVLHEPVDMQQVVRQVEPGIENEQVDEHLKQELAQSELVFPTSPIPVEGGVPVDLPQPHRGVQQQAEQRNHPHLDLQPGGCLALGSLRDRVGVLEEA
jgi:hypothetical protein